MAEQTILSSYGYILDFYKYKSEFLKELQTGEASLHT